MFSARSMRAVFVMAALAAASFLASAATTYEAEPNAATTTATTVALGDYFVGSFSTRSDIDYFKIYVSQPGLYQLDQVPITSSSGSFTNDATAAILDANSVTLASLVTPVRYVASRSFQVSSPGYLYIKVSTDESFPVLENYRYVLTAVPTPAATTYEAEPNAATTTATTVALGDYFVGSFSTRSDIDYFKIYVSQPGLYQLDQVPITSSSGSFTNDATAAILDANSVTLASLVTPVRYVASRSFQVSSPGYLYIKVSTDESFPVLGNYRYVLTAVPTAGYTLTVNQLGAGSGTVVSSPAGISCGATCSASYASGTSVTLSATAGAGSTFAGWSGACSGTGTCTVSMNQAQSVTATFSLVPVNYALSLTKSGTGSGTVSSSPSGISCGATCAAVYARDAIVTLTATPASDSSFAGWSGSGCSGTSICIVSMIQAQSVTATFTLTTGSSPTCTLTASPAPISAGGSSRLTASCSPAATSYSWTGGTCAGTASSSCSVTPTTTTSYTVRGSNAGGAGNIASATVTVVGSSVYTGGVYDGIYQWSSGNYLSLHQDGTHMIATIYFTNDGNFSFPAASGGGVLPVPQLDIFDLMSGQVTGSTVRISGTRFHRACNVAYDFTFNADATITVTRTGVSNTAVADSAGISCSAIVGAEAVTLTVPKIRFN